jgi:3-phenylpropionate/trans-cinnamate dioxygenase ferredoxin subunit
MAFRRAAALTEIPERGGLRVALGDTEIGLFRVGCEVYAIDNACPHAGYPLSEGELDGPIVICCAHGWEFDLRSGANPEAPDVALLRRFPVRLEENAVWVDVDRVIEDA